MIKMSIIFPVLNEKLRLEKGIRSTIEYLDKEPEISYELLIVDNGSEDETPLIAKRLCEEFPSVKYFFINEKGVGVAFRKGVEQSKGEIVGYMDIDLSTNINHLKDVYSIFIKNPQVALVNGSRLNKLSKTTGRKWYRNITSKGLTACLKLFLGMKASDSICGFKFFRKVELENLIKKSSQDNGWFYIIEILLRAERMNLNIFELPVKWEDDYNTTVKIFKLVKYYLVQIFHLRKTFANDRENG